MLINATSLSSISLPDIILRSLGAAVFLNRGSNLGSDDYMEYPAEMCLHVKRLNNCKGIRTPNVGLKIIFEMNMNKANQYIDYYILYQGRNVNI